MKVRKAFLFAAICYCLVASQPGYSWNDTVTHKLIAGYSAEISVFNNDLFLKNIGFNNGASEVLAWNNQSKTTTNWLAEGAWLEDDGARWFRHFHNPLQPWSRAGLWTENQSAILWAQNYNTSQYAISEDL